MGEHMLFTRKLAEAQAREVELRKEHERLKNALQEHGEDPSEELQPIAEQTSGPVAPVFSEEEVAGLRKEAAKMAQQLVLHRAYLIQLEEENRCLHQAHKPCSPQSI